MSRLHGGSTYSMVRCPACVGAVHTQWCDVPPAWGRYRLYGAMSRLRGGGTSSMVRCPACVGAVLAHVLRAACEMNYGVPREAAAAAMERCRTGRHAAPPAVDDTRLRPLWTTGGSARCGRHAAQPAVGAATRGSFALLCELCPRVPGCCSTAAAVPLWQYPCGSTPVAVPLWQYPSGTGPPRPRHMAAARARRQQCVALRPLRAHAAAVSEEGGGSCLALERSEQRLHCM